MVVKTVKKRTTYNISFNPGDGSVAILCKQYNHPPTDRLVIKKVIVEKYSVSAEAMLLSISKTRYVELKRKKRESAIIVSLGKLGNKLILNLEDLMFKLRPCYVLS